MARWTLRIFVLATGLILLLLLAVQIVLMTQLPRNWVLAAIEQKLQLRVGAQEFSTGWSGKTSLTGVTLTLPLAKESFLQAPHLKVHHTKLLGLLVGRPLIVEKVEIDRPNLLVRQASDGRWNMGEVAELIRRAGGGKQPESQQAQQQPPKLPDVVISDGTLRIIDNAGRQATLHSIGVDAAGQGPLVWHCQITIPEVLSIVGDVAPGGAWEHQVQIELAHLGHVGRPFLSPQAARTLDELQLRGRWSGRVGSQFTGRMEFEKFALAGYQAWGAVNVSTANGLQVAPAGLVITTPIAAFPPARATGGTIILSAASATAQGLSLAVAGGELRLSGAYQWTSGTGTLEAWWNKLSFPQGASHGGSLTASLRQPWPNQPLMDVTLATTGEAGDAHWDVQLALAGSGPDWQTIGWNLTAKRLVYEQARQHFDLSNTTIQLSTRGDLITLDRFNIPPGVLLGKWKRGDLLARGQYELSTGRWFAYMTGSRWAVFEHADDGAEFNLNLAGDLSRVLLDEFFLRAGGVQFWASGHYDHGQRGTPLALDLFGWYPPLDYQWVGPGVQVAQKFRVSGLLRSELHLSNLANPAEVGVTGLLYARDFKVQNHPLGDVSVGLTGQADGERLRIGTTHLKLLSGTWDLDFNYSLKDKLARIIVDLKDLSLAQLDNLLAPPPNMRGTLHGHWSIHLPNFDLGRMEMEGNYAIDDLALFTPPPAPPSSGNQAVASDDPRRDRAIPAAYVIEPRLPVTGAPKAVRGVTSFSGSATRPTTAPAGKTTPLAQHIEGNITSSQGMLRLDPIRLKAGDGRADFKIALPIRNPRQVSIEGAVSAWPLYVRDEANATTFNALLWGETRLALDLKNGLARGPLTLTTNVAIKNQGVLRATLNSELNQRRIDLKSVSGDLLGGTLSGDGYIYLDAPLQSAGRIMWNGIDLTRLAELYPAVKGLEGAYSGSLIFSPVPTDRREQMPGTLALKASLHSEGGQLQALPLGDLEFLAYLDPNRAILDRFRWNVAEGTIAGWARVTWYSSTAPFVHAKLKFDDLDLDQIVRAARPKGQHHEPMPGKLSGNVVAAGNPFTDEGRREASGDAHVEISKSDLVNVDAVTALYNVLSLKGADLQPSGQGFVNARLEGQRLEIPVARYFNRGVDLWASLSVNNIFSGTRAALEGSAAGSARPLRDLKLPFMADMDQLLRALQGSMATVALRGTVGDPDVKVIPFAESGEGLRRFLVGEVKNEVRVTPGR